MAGEVLTDQAEDMVTAWRTRLAEHPHLAIYSAAPDGSLNPDYSAASKPRFVRWVIDACTRPFDQTWLDYQEIGLRHTRDKKNVTDHVESVDHEAYAKLGDEPCEQVSDLRERRLLIMFFKGFA
jgi:hypothetical protein